MITYDNGVFRLGNEEFCYLLRVTNHGQLEHLHFGLPVKAEDFWRELEEGGGDAWQN